MKNLAHSPFHGPSPLEIMKASIKHLQLFGDRSDAACRVVAPPAAARGKAPDAAPYRSLGKNYINAPAFNALRRGIKKTQRPIAPAP